MGAWGFGTFDNDDASDWLYELEEASDLSIIAATLGVVTDIGDEYLEAPDCSNALAAAEIVAALSGHPAAKLPEIAKDWVETHRALDASSLVRPAQAAIQRIRTNSELKALWDETYEAASWYAALNELSFRLNLR